MNVADALVVAQTTGDLLDRQPQRFGMFFPRQAAKRKMVESPTS
jgi:hypothetical protein